MEPHDTHNTDNMDGVAGQDTVSVINKTMDNNGGNKENNGLMEFS